MDIINEIINNGATEAEAFNLYREKEEFVFQNGEINDVTNTITNGYSLRAKFNNRIGFVATYSLNNRLDLIKDLRNISLISEEETYSLDNCFLHSQIINSSSNISIESLLHYASSIDHVIKQIDQNIYTQIVISKEHEVDSLSNSGGFNYYYDFYKSCISEEISTT